MKHFSSNKWRIFITVIIFNFLNINALLSQDHVISLWGDTVPNQTKTNEKESEEKSDILLIKNVQNPLIEVYLPNKRMANKKAVLIFPGGGYQVLAYDWEGRDVAKYLNSVGIAGIVVKYRLPISKSLNEQYNVPLQDAQRAIRLVRSYAEEWNISTDQIGILGFSAGGHLASTLGTQFNRKVYDKTDEADSLSTRPDFMGLLYPVIAMDEGASTSSDTALLGEHPTETLINQFSNDKQVTAETPPTFIVHAVDDPGVPLRNSLSFMQALLENDVNVEIHIFPEGGHGFSMATTNEHLKVWPELFLNWIHSLAE